MPAERWSSTAWVVALVVDVALCVYLAANASMTMAHPPPGPRAAELALPHETICGRPYLLRLLAAVDLIELQMWSLVDEQAAVTSPAQRDLLQEKIDDANGRLGRIHDAYAHCDAVAVGERWTATRSTEDPQLACDRTPGGDGCTFAGAHR